MELEPETKKVGAKVGADENEGLESPYFPFFLIERSTPKRKVVCSNHIGDASKFSGFPLADRYRY